MHINYNTSHNLLLLQNSTGVPHPLHCLIPCGFGASFAFWMENIRSPTSECGNDRSVLQQQ